MTALSPENQATLDRIDHLLFVGGKLGGEPTHLDHSELDLIMTAVRNEALAPAKMTFPDPEALPRLLVFDKPSLEALELFRSNPAALKTNLLIASGYMRGAGHAMGGMAVLIALTNLFPETDFG